MNRLADQARKHPLSAEAMGKVMEQIMTGKLPPAEIKELLSVMAARGETAEEIAAAVEILRRHAPPLPFSKRLELCDTCGTGGDGADTFNISTLAALVVAASGIPVSKHGNRAASSRCGSADMLEALGLNLQAPPERVTRSIEVLGFGFCFAPMFHPAMKLVAPIRKELGIRTIFNLIGPLANPAPLTFQLVGVSDAKLMQPMAEALQRLGVRHGMVVHGRDGLDEVTTTSETDYLDVQPRLIERGSLKPEEFNYSRTTAADLAGGDAAANAAIAREVLSGKPSRKREIVALNAGCAISLAGRAHSIPEGVAKAESALESGRALALLERVIEFSKQA